MRTINQLRKNWISARKLYQLCEEAPQLPDYGQNKGHLLRWTLIARYPQRMSIANNATFAAGGQILSCSVITGTTALSRLGYAQLFFNSISQARRNISSLSFEQRSFFSKHDFKRKATTINKTAQSFQFINFDIFYSYDCHHRSSCYDVINDYTDSLALRRWRYSTSRFSDYSDSLAFQRCSYFNLRPQASKTHAEKLALGLVNFSCSTLASIPSISSCGNRIFFFADLLFVLPLDIDAPHLNGLYGRTQYSKKNEMLSIDMCAHMILICAHSLSFVTQIKQRPAVLATHAGRLTTNDSRSIEAAMRNYTRHPQGRDSHNLNKYIWRFIALSTAQPRVITIEATSEQEARQQSPAGCVMVFAARIRQEVCHVQ